MIDEHAIRSTALFRKWFDTPEIRDGESLRPPVFAACMIIAACEALEGSNLSDDEIIHLMGCARKMIAATTARVVTK